MSRFSPALRLALLITWAVAVVTTLVAYALLAVAALDPMVVVAALALANVPGGVAICAMTHPGGMAIFTNAGYRTWIGWLTTAAIVAVLNALVALVASLVLRNLAPWAVAVMLAGTVVVAHFAGLILYYVVGELFVSAVLVATARARAAVPPLERLAAGLIVPLVLALGASAGASLRAFEPGVATRGDTVARLLGALVRFDGTPQEQLFQWLTRCSAIALVCCIVWLLVLVRRASEERGKPRHAWRSKR